MNSTEKKIGKLIILLAPLDPFKILGSYFSLYRILVLLFLPIVIIRVLSNRGKIRIDHKLFLALLLLFVSNILAITVTSNPSLGLSFFLNDCFGLLIIFEFLVTFCYKDRIELLLTYVRSQYISAAFAIYTIILHYVFGAKIPSTISLLFMQLKLDSNQLQLLSRTRSYWPQIFLPYSTTLHFDMSVGLAAIICIYFVMTNRKNKNFFLVLSIIFSGLIMMSAQRGPIIAFIISILAVLRCYFKKVGTSKSVKFIAICLLIGIVFSSTFGGEIVMFTIRRFAELGHNFTTSDRHVLLVYEAIRTWLESCKNFFIGTGYADKSLTNGFYTNIPETYLCTYATIIAERGLFGVVAFCFYYMFIPKFHKSNWLLGNLLLFILISFTFYELRYIQTTWVMYAIFASSYITYSKKKEIV